MYLDTLTIRASSKEIRSIKFKKGLNLVVDETTSFSTDSGNNVGKTTFLRAIDFCLGGKKTSIYTEKEFDRKNEKLYQYLIKNDLTFELTLLSKKGTLHRIIRPIEGKATVDGLEMSEPKFLEAIQLLLFGFKGGRPTLGQLMNKFIRVEDYQLSNALYFLHPMADHSEYEALFTFLFGFRNTELLGKKRKVVDRVKKLQKSVEESNSSVEDLEQQLHLINKDIVGLEKLKSAKDFVKGVDAELEVLKSLQTEISDLKSLVARLNLKYEMNRESLRQLRDSKTNINVDAITKLYRQAKVELPQLTKKFEDVLHFHNQMIDSKAKFLEGVLSKVDKLLSETRKTLNSRLSEESKTVSSMASKGALDEYDKISLKLQDKSREKGIREGLLNSLESLNGELANAKKELEAINLEIESFSREFRKNLARFNEFFSDYSFRLYGDKYYLTTVREHNRTTDNFLLDIGNMNENVGTGKKKAQISALDLAYLQYSDESSFQLPLFVLHDQLETVFENQIETLFQLSNSMQGQFVVAVLSDKLKKIEPEEVTNSCILRLSQTDKLFKLD